MIIDPERQSRFERARRLFVFTVLIASTLACDSTPNAPSDAERARRETIRTQLRTRMGADYDREVPVATTAQLLRGARVYASLCSGCHGENGAGNGRAAATLPIRPADLTHPTSVTFFSDAARLEIIRHGIPGSTMIGWEDALGEADLLAVFSFVRSLAPAEEIGS